MRIIGGLIAVAFVLGVSACGSSGDESEGGGDAPVADAPASGDSGADAAAAPSDEEAAEEAVRAYSRALADGDGEAACRVLTAEQQDALASTVGSQLSTVKTCAQAVEAGARLMSPEELDVLRDPVIESVTVDGTTASVTFQGAAPNELTKTASGWQISKLPGG